MRVWLLLLLLARALAVAQDRGATHHAAAQAAGGPGPVRLRKGTVGELLLEEADPCLTFSDLQERLRCSRSRFNLNPFGLRFGKRLLPRRAARPAPARTLSPVSQDVPA